MKYFFLVCLLVFCASVWADQGCYSNSDCGGPQYYCAKDRCDAAGFCAATPTSCFSYYDLVCGCDGVSYNSTCFAAMLGRTSVAYIGGCMSSSSGASHVAASMFAAAAGFFLL